MSRELTREEWAEIRRAAGRVSLEPSGKPRILIGYQSRLMETVSHNAVTVIEKSRRTGVTWGAAAIAVLTSTARKTDGGMDTLYIGYNLDMAREFIDTAAEWARKFNSAVQALVEETLFDDGPDNAIKAFRITFASGFEILALSSKPRSLRGRQGFVIIDEAAFHDDLPGLMQAALALLIWGGKILIISTHMGDANPFNQLVMDVRSGRRPYALLRVDFDDALRDGLYERICDTTGVTWSPEREAQWRDDLIAQYGEGADEELYCIPSAGSGLWLTTPLIEARMKGDPSTIIRLEKPEPFTHLPKNIREAEILDWCEQELKPLLDALDPKEQHVFGEDFGRVSDLTVIWPLAIRRDLTRITPFVVELRKIPFEQQSQVLFYIVDRLPRLVAGKLDATGNGAYLAEVAAQRYGEYRIEQVKLSIEWYREFMPRVRRHFEEATIVIPRDSEIREDLRLVCVDKGVAQIPAVKTKTKNGATRHGDAAVAIALAIAASEADPVEYAYRPARPRAADQSFTSAGTGSLFGLSGLDFDIPPRRGGL